MAERRPAQVCDRCRVKRVKCDGRRPKCGKCERAGAECSVSVQLKRRTTPRGYIEPTEELIQQLTQELESARDQLQLLSAREEGLRETIVSQKKEIEQLKELVTASRPGGYTQHGGERASNGSVVAHLGRLVLGDGNSEFFAGSTTGVHFVLSAQQLYQTTFSSQEHFPECLFRLHILRPNGSPVALEQPISVESCLGDGHLTSGNIFESLRNHLRNVGVVAIREAFDKYQQCWGILYPVLLSKQFLDTFDDTINDAWTTSMEPHLRVPFLLQVYALIALQSIHSSTAATESRPLSYHLDTILSNLLGHMPCRGDIPSLQGLILYLLYLQMTSQHSLAVRVCGMVVRLAQSLGLHRHTRRFKHSPGESELRRRIWWSVYVLDVQSSILYGLPRNIQAADTDTDLPTNTDYDDMHSDQLSYPLPGETTHIEPFLQYVHLAQILSRCLEQMYTTTNRRGGVAKIFRLQRELDLWKQNVQSSLPNVARTGELIQTRLHNRNNNNTAYNPVERPDIISLWLFILGELATMLIHRPALTFGQQEPQLADSLRSCKEATTHLILAFELASEVSFTPHIWPSGHHLVLQSGLMLLYDRWVQTPTQRPGISSEPDTLPQFIHIAITLLSKSAAHLDERVGSGRPRSPSTTDTIESLRQASSYLHYLCTRTLDSQGGSWSWPPFSQHSIESAIPQVRPIVTDIHSLARPAQPTLFPDYSPSLWAPLSIDEINQMEIFELTDPLLIPWEN
ncbi:hypothetical protein BDV37DRAFT_165721 [Aspergillus pseudonomiae]|uniref:Zn(2)-C6 fungal-type domain-containing protein n=1 Tax=Aspergillus pseudonomiae TaxID=1506151 RepID=A0A5N7D6P9_9EURO|nr:uncharacterized protein BDV37DRAFT_165721 [Aspergillus pseudonomiae]KAE8402102.1 hypothetical protein BDV37DRAFT_165721 [Aspergillus pseudonomiae]